ncbi:MAG: DUF1573 domain-containing protein [Firmicutes bacterium]|nr:DUF1573 domain-containing protein [Bacillota bacterium]
MGIGGLMCSEFQQRVDECLLRHRSVLDVLSKLQEASSRTNRAVTKAVTSCGCIQIIAEKQNIPLEIPLEKLNEYVESHLKEQLCSDCREVIESELGRSLFYTAALCNLLDIDLYDVLVKEHKKLCTLGKFNLS